MEFFHSWQDFFTFDRKEIARFFQDATAFMDGFHGSFAAEELYAGCRLYSGLKQDDLDEPHHARKGRMGPAAGTGIALFDIDEADDAPQLIVFLTKAILSEFRVRNIMKGNGMIFPNRGIG